MDELNIELRDLAVRLATTAAERALDLRRTGVDVAGTKSTPTDVVTRADRETEDFLRDELARRRPRDGFLGEEGEESGTSSGITWVVDPIDGTVNYLYGLPAWAVSVAAVDEAAGRTLAGCVVSPATGTVYAAAAGHGAIGNGRPLQLEPRHDLGQALVATGFAYAAERRLEQARVLSRLITQVRDIRRIGAASLDLCMVANGLLDGYYEVGLNPWDHAAGALVVREAGGRVGGLPGEPEDERLVVAANPGLFDALEHALTEARS